MPTPAIVFDLIGLQTPSAGRGIGRYTRGLALALNREAPGRVEFWADPSLPLESIPRCLPRAGTPWAGRWRLVSSPFEPSRLPITRGSTDLAAIVYDRTPARFPESCLPTKEQVTKYRAQTDAVLTCDRLLAISESAGHEFRLLGAKSIRVIGSGVDVSPAITIKPLLMPDDFFLCVTTLDQHKNVDLLVMVALHDPVLFMKCPFVIAGRSPISMVERFQSEVRELGVESCFRFLNDAQDGTLAAYYDRCRALVAPSLWEGLGLPVLEARAHGVIALASDIAAHRESQPRDDLRFDPRDVLGLVNRLKAVIVAGPSELASWRNPLDLQEWSWDATARRVLEALD